ncbi:MAG: 4-hydroxy-3-methylbut-2-enyl diphosphate reductase [Termitinemataceae bacterium]|nr:MAG: 4-hydroxy-3-methylbut-2-enyl diphosphate reductase [Termitinemataceae bacterium]
MQIIKARRAGFCSGVERAVETAFKTAKSLRNTRLYTLGPLIHNDTVLSKLAHLGFSTLDEGGLFDGTCLSNLKGATVIIRAHGIKPALQEEIISMGANIVDATCPKVRANQLKARKLCKKDHRLWIVGEKNHAEVQGLLGFAPEAVVISSVEDAKDTAEELFFLNRSAKTAVIAQTTISNKEFDAICGILHQFFPDLAVYNTICTATQERQQALQELCAQVDAVLIAGDPKSSNTRRLLSIAKENCKNAWIAANIDDIPPEIYKYKTIGLSAGASTPMEVISAIENHFRNIHS